MYNVFVPNLKNSIGKSNEEYYQFLEATTSKIVDNILSSIQTQLENNKEMNRA